MKRLHAALLALPLVIPAMAYAKEHKPDSESKADWHAEMCNDHYAHAFGKLAYLQAKLGITDKQQDAWNKFSQAESDGAAKERDACLADTLPSGDTPPSVLDQEDHLEKMLSAKLGQLQSSRPALVDLYKVLSTEQKEEFDQFGEDMIHHAHGGHGPEGPKGEHGHDDK